MGKGERGGGREEGKGRGERGGEGERDYHIAFYFRGTNISRIAISKQVNAKNFFEIKM